ncbi:hypothetical protein [Leptospira idonii]|uniref:DUF3619 family protein n=1 Tax=Leptospira idonii TaxID=1193500 RepID=A0A4R9M4W1_9LEPT|nr:hypothetical protein [Leptospira idonii]TGN20865.1 hypothetical protein EHS15_01345 [Leptospira idonii]
MKEESKSQLDQVIDRLIQDPDFSKRTAIHVLKAASSQPKASNHAVWYYVAAAVVFFIFSVSEFWSFNSETPNYRGTISAEEVSAPEESEFIWNETDSLILTSFGSR